MADTPIVIPQGGRVAVPETGAITEAYLYLLVALVRRVNELSARVAALEAP